MNEYKEKSFLDTCRDLKVGSTVLLRVDFNLSRDSQGCWLLNDRLYRVIPVIKQLLAMQFGVILVSHLGRPRPGIWESSLSLSTLCDPLERLLGKSVTFLSDWPRQKTYLAAGSVALAENTRFLVGETDNNMRLAQQMVDGVDCVMMEAFACSHRRHASTFGVLNAAKMWCLGPEHEKEILGMDHFLQTSSPRVAFIGGKKISTKLPLLTKLLETVDVICFGGGIASTLLHVKGYQTGTSWVEYSCREQVAEFFHLADRCSVKLVLPSDVQVSADNTDFRDPRVVAIDEILPHENIVDIGQASISSFVDHAESASSIYWNGPMGIYEYPSGIQGSADLARAISNAQAYSLVGGGDTLSVLDKLGIHAFSHVSTGGGAFLYYLANGTTHVLDARTRLKEIV